jgi:hypothetical protein
LTDGVRLGVLGFTRAEREVFVAGVKASEFDPRDADNQRQRSAVSRYCWIGPKNGYGTYSVRVARSHQATPKVRTPQQADRWTWLILAALTQLRLARDHVGDHRLPWQPPLSADKMTPGRVRAGFAHLLSHVNDPTNAPKPSRPGPGRPKGRKSAPAPRYPAVKKTNTARKTNTKARKKAKRG